MPNTPPIQAARRHLCVALMSLSLMSAAASQGRSSTQIEPGQIFVLGGEQTAPLLVEGRNTGPVAVEILNEKAGRRTPVGRVAPGSLFSKTFGAGEAVLVRNTSRSQRAVIAVEFNRNVSSLSMRYINAP
jgi:hypothetical protein